MSKDVFVTGQGIVSALGLGVEENLSKLLKQETGIGPIQYLQTEHQHIFPSGELNKTHDELKALLGIPDEEPITRTMLLGIIAIQEALEQAQVTPSEHRVALISSTTVAGMDRSEMYYSDFKLGKKIEYVSTHLCGATTNRMAQYHGINGLVTTISTACSSSANAMMMASRLITSGRYDIVVAGGSDALSKFTVNGFNSLMILDKEWCQPFDNNRRGLNLGEAAAYLVLESEESYKRRGVLPLARLSGYCNANDAFHQTASSPNGEGATLAMQGALKQANLNPTDIDYINVHGTGTGNNDLSEGMACINIFGEEVPKFSSTKAYTGHTLAAAGSVEAVFSILSLRERTIFPNLNWKVGMKEFDLKPVTELLDQQELKHIMSNSFGFGGNNTTLIYSRA